jgi:membrane protease YdiL (CAAX protease family)
LSEEPPPKFSHFDAVVWTAGVTFTFLLVAGVVHGQAEQIDSVKIAALQLAVYLSACTLFSWRREGKSFSELFALRWTSPWLLLLCLLLGPALLGPVQTLGRLVEHFAPESPEHVRDVIAALLPRDQLHAVLLFVLLGLGGPLVEELLFRGAIYTALRPGFAAASALWTATLCFTLAHPTPRDWLVILLPALVLTLVRAQSGSLWASFLAHAGFNGTRLIGLWWVKGKSIEVPVRYEIGGWALCAVLLAAVLLIARRSGLAREARAVDEVAPAGGLEP